MLLNGLEHFVLLQSLSVMDTLAAPARAVVSEIVSLYALTCIQRDLAWYLCEGILRVNEAGMIKGQVDTCVQNLTPHMSKLLNGFEIPEELIQTPIAQDWVEFNKVHNRGEVHNINLTSF